VRHCKSACPLPPSRGTQAPSFPLCTPTLKPPRPKKHHPPKPCLRFSANPLGFERYFNLSGAHGLLMTVNTAAVMAMYTLTALPVERALRPCVDLAPLIPPGECSRRPKDVYGIQLAVGSPVSLVLHAARQQSHAVCASAPCRSAHLLRTVVCTVLSVSVLPHFPPRRSRHAMNITCRQLRVS
jgi:hypothetical protein